MKFRGQKYTVWDVVRSISGILLFFVIFLAATPVIILLLLLSLGRLTNFVMEKVAPLLVMPVLWALGIRFRIRRHGSRPGGPAVYIVNHSSTLDLLTILALGVPRVRFVAKWELQYNPIFFILGRLTGQVFIKRQQSSKAVETLQRSYRRLKRKNLSVLLAPEGSRKHPGTIGPFKKGPFHMAIDLGYPIVPVYFEGARKLSVGGSLLTRPGEITGHIHSPVETDRWSKETLEEHIGEVRARYLDWAGVEEDDLPVTA